MASFRQRFGIPPRPAGRPVPVGVLSPADDLAKLCAHRVGPG